MPELLPYIRTPRYKNSQILTQVLIWPALLSHSRPGESNKPAGYSDLPYKLSFGTELCIRYYQNILPRNIFISTVANSQG
ncbi:MAG: hypothetical protein QOH96_1456 [Blastocatellia bacterium]|nr:hypothetical protein [Blastocatellia bacterium]